MVRLCLGCVSSASRPVLGISYIELQARCCFGEGALFHDPVQSGFQVFVVLTPPILVMPVGSQLSFD